LFVIEASTLTALASTAKLAQKTRRWFCYHTGYPPRFISSLHALARRSLASDRAGLPGFGYNDTPDRFAYSDGYADLGAITYRKARREPICQLYRRLLETGHLKVKIRS
jgi:hypothetical protein